jgi:hypothetical protein
MNTNTSKWAVEIGDGNANLSEAIQTIAFSYGFTWDGFARNNWGENVVDHTLARFLVFNPETKVITCRNFRKDVENECSQLVSKVEDVVNLFKSPPSVSVSVKVGTDITVNKTGDVYMKTFVIGSELFEQIVSIRNKLLGKKNKFPVARFSYTSQNSGRKVRNVIVTDMNINNGLLTGLDIDDNDKFKKFLTSKISGPVELRGFVES